MKDENYITKNYFPVETLGFYNVLQEVIHCLCLLLRIKVPIDIYYVVLGLKANGLNKVTYRSLEGHTQTCEDTDI